MILRISRATPIGNKKNIMLVRLALVTCCLWALTHPALAEPALVDRLPSQTLLYVGWAGRSLTFDGSAAGQLLSEPTVKQILGMTKALVQTRMPDKQGEIFAQVWSMGAIAWEHPVAVALTDLKATANRITPLGVLLIDLGTDREAFAETVNKLLELLAEEHTVTEAAAGGLTYKIIRRSADVPEIALGFIDDVFFLAVGSQTPQQLIGLTDENALGSDKLFATSWKELAGANEQLGFYLAVPKLLAKIESITSPPDAGTQPATQGVSKLQRVIQALGLQKVSAVAGSTRIVDRGMYTRVRVLTPAPHRGVLAPLSGAALTDADFAGVPEDTEIAIAIKLSPEALYREILHCLRQYSVGTNDDMEARFLREIARIEKDLGVSLTEEILPSLGDSVILSAASSQGGFLTGTLVSISLRDAEKFSKAVTKAAESFRKRLPVSADSGRGLSIQTIRVDRTEIHYLAGNLGFPLPLAPAWSIHKDRLYLAGFPQVIATAIANGAAERPLTAEANFRKVRGKVSEKSCILSYTNTPKIIRHLYPAMLLGWTIGANALADEASISPRAHWLPALSTLEKLFFPEISAVSSDEGGITLESYGSLPVTGAGLAPVVFPLGLSMLLPSFKSARHDAKCAVSRANLSHIGRAMYFYQEDHDGELPPDLDSLIRENPYLLKSLVSPLSGKEAPKLVDGKLVGEIDYIYLTPQKSTEITASQRTILAYERPENYHGRGTNVLFAEGGVEFMRTPQFRAALKFTTEHALKGQRDQASTHPVRGTAQGVHRKNRVKPQEPLTRPSARGER